MGRSQDSDVPSAVAGSVAEGHFVPILAKIGASVLVARNLPVVAGSGGGSGGRGRWIKLSAKVAPIIYSRELGCLLGVALKFFAPLMV